MYFVGCGLQPLIVASWETMDSLCSWSDDIRNSCKALRADADPIQCCADNNNNNNQNGYPRDQSRRRYFSGGQYYAYGQGPYAQAAYYEAPVSALCSFTLWQTSSMHIHVYFV